MSQPTPLPPSEVVPGFDALGVTAFTTTRQAGSFNLGGHEPAGEVYARWIGLAGALGAARLACAHQVHGDRILVHDGGWSGWLRDAVGADGHLSAMAGTAMAVTLADCVPVFLAHPDGLAGVLHSGWKGTAAGITRQAIDRVAALGYDARAVRVHLGPAICGACYEVGPEVHFAVSGARVASPRPIDLRAAIANSVRDLVAAISISDWCTRCHNDRFYSHRGGDAGRQVGVIRIG
ncbi:MAG: polyphenol oxidase family protein [Gemmatimonadaceae bacterium]|nr:polyphenol oxidase family protein [Gemmatimonadaceae bacterium]